MELFFGKLYFSYTTMDTTIDENTTYGYISRNEYGEYIVKNVSQDEYRENIRKAFAHIEAKGIIVDLIFDFCGGKAITMGKDFGKQYTTALFCSAYEYLEFVNKTIVSVFVDGKLVGSVFPPCELRSTAGYRFFPHTNPDVVIPERYIEVAEKHKNYESLFPQVNDNENLEGEDVLTATLYINNKPVLYYPYTLSRFNGMSREWRYECPCNNLLEYYTCAYAQSLLNDDEMLLIDFSGGSSFRLCGVSITTERIRFIANANPAIAINTFLRQPFLIIHSNSDWLDILIPQNFKISGMGCMKLYRKAGALLSGNYEQLYPHIINVVNLLCNDNGVHEFTDWKNIFTQVFGYNKAIDFADSTFAKDLLSWY